MFYYKAHFQYAGTNYAGFQWQKESATVQGEINKALSQLIPEKVTTVAASRTDTGVHALEQIVKITSSESIRPEIFIEKLNSRLPGDIICKILEVCPGTFRPASDARGKEYRYFFTNSTRVSNEQNRFMANIANPLNVAAIEECLQHLVGMHDFCNFCSSGSNVKSTIRTVIKAELTVINPHSVFFSDKLFIFPETIKQCYQLQIEANGFLKQMIRHLVSALWMVGSGKMTVIEFRDLLDSPKSEKQLWKVASPNGLFLFKIHY